jgi:hypothetical protein
MYETIQEKTQNINKLSRPDELEKLIGVWNSALCLKASPMVLTDRLSDPKKIISYEATSSYNPYEEVGEITINLNTRVTEYPDRINFQHTRDIGLKERRAKEIANTMIFVLSDMLCNSCPLQRQGACKLESGFRLDEGRNSFVPVIKGEIK